MTEPTIPPQLQADLQQLQGLNAQLQALAQQKAQFEVMKAEAQEALEALSNLPDDAPVYRNVGALLVREPGKKAAQDRLAEDLETLGIRLGRLQKQEESVRSSAGSLQKKIQAALPKQ